MLADGRAILMKHRPDGIITKPELETLRRVNTLLKRIGSKR